MITYAEYRNGDYTYEEYISQFVDRDIKRQVLMVFDMEELLNTADQEHFNNLSLNRWDKLTGYGFKGIKQRGDIHQKIKDTGNSPTYSVYTSIYKMAAKQLVAEHKS